MGLPRDHPVCLQEEGRRHRVGELPYKLGSPGVLHCDPATRKAGYRLVTAPPIEIGGIQGFSAQRLQPQSHNIDRRVLVTVHRQPTVWAGMDSIREGLFDDHTTSGTLL